MDEIRAECPECEADGWHPVVEVIPTGYGAPAEYQVECVCGARFYAGGSE